MIKKTLCTIAVLAMMAASSQAAIRTIDIDYGAGSVGWIVDTIPATGATIDDATGLGLDIYHEENDPGDTTFSSTGLAGTFNAGIEFANGSGDMLRLVLPGTGSALSAVADGVYTGTMVNLGPGTGNTTGLTVTLGTAAVPEPSAFAFGGLALALTGLRRWGRNWFGKKS